MQLWSCVRSPRVSESRWPNAGRSKCGSPQFRQRDRTWPVPVTVTQPVHTLDLERLEEALHGRMVPTIRLTTH